MRRKLLSVDEYVTGILAGDRVMLGQAITLVESAREEHIQVAEAVLARLSVAEPGRADQSIRVAVTGAPGVGKSTFIESLGWWLTEQGKKVAVLAIDPSSALSKGSILGDKTRMERLSVSDRAFIRPSPAGNTLGGVAQKTRQTIMLAEAAGFEVILVETVGVGQSEMDARRMCDLFLLLLLPGAGDELQGIKRGIVEMADILVVNKADGDRKNLAAIAQAHYRNAVHLLSPHPGEWTPKVLTASATEHTGIEKIWETVLEYHTTTTQNGYWAHNRRQQSHFWLHETLSSGLRRLFYEHPFIQSELAVLEPEVVAGRISPDAAARRILVQFKNTFLKK